MALNTPPIFSDSLPWHDPVSAFAGFADQPYGLLMLADGSVPFGRWSFLLPPPDDVIEIENLSYGQQGFRQARTWLADPSFPDTAPDPDAPPFLGGVAGLMGYEAANASERLNLPTDPQGWPALVYGVYRDGLAYDHQKRVVWVFSRNSQARADRLARTVAEHLAHRPQTAQQGAGDGVRATMTPEPPARYQEAVAACVADICAGEVFQANLSRAWSGQLASGHPYDVLRYLSRHSPSPMGGYFRLPQHALVSNSPERFFRVWPEGGGRWAESAPIKGTTPRGQTPEDDEALAEALLASEKDLAENRMIVDLMRNDLARWCVPGQVTVPECAGLYRFAHVQHLISRVRGRLRPGVRALDVLETAFPAGSITGAPKIRAMEIIRDAEGAGRGPYCGSLFWAGFDGQFDSNVLIRSLMARQSEGGDWDLRFRAGGGITALSDPMAEWQETETKALGLLRALGVRDPATA